MTKTTDAFRGKVAKSATAYSGKSGVPEYLKIPSNIKMFNPVAGKEYELDFLPYIVTDPKHLERDDKIDQAIPGNLWYRKPYITHRDIGIDNKRILCLKTFGKKCPVCEHFAERKDEGADWDTELKLIAQKQRSLYAVVVLNSKDYDPDSIYLFDFSDFLFQDLLKEELEMDESNEIFPSLEEGMTLVVRFRQGKNGKFAEASRINFKKRVAQYDPGIIDEVPKLDECFHIPTYEQINEMFWELDEDGAKSDDNAPIEAEHKPLRRLREPKEDKEESKETTGVDFKKRTSSVRTVKTSSKTEEPKSESQYTWEVLEGASFRKLSRICIDETLTVQASEYNVEEIDELRLAIAEELGIDINTEEPKEAPEKSTKISRRLSTTKTEDSTPTSRRRMSEPVAVATGGTGRCPHGHQFGADLDMFPECAQCKIVDDCEDDYNKNHKK